MATIVGDFIARLGLKPDKKSWDKGDELIGGLKAKLGWLVGGAAVVGLTHMVGSVIELGSHINDLAQSTGISTDALQELGFAAGLAGIDSEALTGSLKKFSAGMQDAAATGKGPLMDALRKLRIPFKALKGESLDQNLELIANRFASMPNGAKKTALAMDLFGKSGAQLIPLLNEGQAGIVKLRNEAQELGVVLDKDTIEGLDNVGDDMDRVKAATTGLRNQAVAALLPTIRELVTGLLAWVKANRELIKNTIQAAVQGIVTALQVLGKVVGVIVDVFNFFVENAELGESVLIALGVVIAAFAIKAAIAWAIAFAPVIAAIAVLAAIVLGIRALVKNWDQVKAAMRGAASAIGNALDRIWNGIKDVGNRILKFFTEDIPNGIRDAIIAAFDAVKDAVKGFWESLTGGVDIKGAIQKVSAEKAGAATASTGEPTATIGPARAVTGNEVASNTSSNNRTLNVGGITVNSTSADPEAVAAAVDRKITERLDTMLLQTQEVVG